MSRLRVAHNKLDPKPIKVWVEDSEGLNEQGGVDLSAHDAMQIMLLLSHAIDAVEGER